MEVKKWILKHLGSMKYKITPKYVSSDAMPSDSRSQKKKKSTLDLVSWVIFLHPKYDHMQTSISIMVAGSTHMQISLIAIHQGPYEI